MSFAKKSYDFFTRLKFAHKLPKGVEVMNPYVDATVRRNFRAFVNKYFDDDRKRVFLFGINPSRFGAGITGVAFTDPKALEDILGIPNDGQKIRELSSTFVYQFVEAYGGPRKFFRDFFITATCPLGFTKNGVNYNFYDDAELARDVTPFIVQNVKAHIAMGGRTDVAIILGTGKLAAYWRALNDEHRFFETLVPLEHPRFIMQYRRKRIGEFVDKYVAALKAAAKTAAAPAKTRKSK